MSLKGPDRRAFPAGVRACAWCGTVKPFRAGIKYCSQVCVGYGRTMTLGDDHLRTIAQRASAAASAKRRAEAEAAVVGMTAEAAYRLGRKRGYAEGYNSARYRDARDARRGAA